MPPVVSAVVSSYNMSMPSKEFETGVSTIIYSNRRWDIISTPVETQDGTQYWEQLRSHSPGVVVVPVDNQGRLGVIHQNRVLGDGKCHVVYEFPCGWTESNTNDISLEEAQGNATRELREEIGFSGKLTLLTRFRLGNFAVVPFYVFLATDLVENRLQADEGELIGLEWLSIDDAKQRLTLDQTPTAQALVALQAYRDYLV